MNRGRILAEGTIDELTEKYDETDVEELFYQLISVSEMKYEACRESVSSIKSTSAAQG